MNKASHWYFSALSGLLASGFALVVGEIAAGFSSNTPTIVEGFGNALIDSKLIPAWFRKFSIDNAGTAQKPLIILGVVLTILIIGIGLGVLVGWLGSPKRKNFSKKVSGYRFLIAGCVIAVYGVLSGLNLADQKSVVYAIFTNSFSVGIAFITLFVLIKIAEGKFAPFDSRIMNEPTNQIRRNFLVGAGATAITATVGGFWGRRLINYQKASQSRTAAAQLLQELAPNPNVSSISGTYDDIKGMTKFVTPNSKFYLIDTALTKPTINHNNWSLKVTGKVKNELEFSYRDIIEMGLVEEMVTLSCVSNNIGGSLVGNAVWRGVPLTKILDMAKVESKTSTQVVGHSHDGWTSGFPTSLVYEPNRICLVALEMNGEPLPKIHGFPARLVIAGLYGYVSATKWLTEIEITDLSFDSYWIPRGWSKNGPVKTQSRIDIPRFHEKLAIGRHPIAGIAWAPHRGISKVEISVGRVNQGNNSWREAKLSTNLENSDWQVNSWCQWQLGWDFTESGEYEIKVRATDGNGVTQTSLVTDPLPNGASGWDRTRVRIS